VFDVQDEAPPHSIPRHTRHTSSINIRTGVENLDIELQKVPREWKARMLNYAKKWRIRIDGDSQAA